MIRVNSFFLIAFLFFFPVFTANPIPSRKLLSINQIQIVTGKVDNIIQGETFYVSLAAFQDEAEAEAYLLQLSNLESTIKHEFNRRRKNSRQKIPKDICDLKILHHFSNIDTFGKLMFDFRKHLYLHVELTKDHNVFQGNKEEFYAQEGKRLNLKKTFPFKGTSVDQLMSVREKHNTNLVLLIMAKNVKMLLEKTYPSLNGKVKIDESTRHLIDITFYIQNSKRYINKVLLKRNIENIILEQEYDTLVIPSNLYSDKTSMKKFRDFYDDFYEGNLLEHFQKFINKKLITLIYDGRNGLFLELIKNTAPLLYRIKIELMNYNSKQGINTEFSDNISENIFPTNLETFKYNKKKVLNKQETIEDHEIFLRFAFTSILPWAMILEWVCSFQSKTQTHIPIHLSQFFLNEILWYTKEAQKNFIIENEIFPDFVIITSKEVDKSIESKALSSYSTNRKKKHLKSFEDKKSSKLNFKNSNLDKSTSKALTSNFINRKRENLENLEYHNAIRPVFGDHYLGKSSEVKASGSQSTNQKIKYTKTSEEPNSVGLIASYPYLVAKPTESETLVPNFKNRKRNRRRTLQYPNPIRLVFGDPYLEAETTKSEAPSSHFTNGKRKQTETSEDTDSLKWFFENFHSEAEPTKPEASSSHFTNRKRKQTETSEDPESLEWFFKNFPS
ncbi:hypothetical protein HMI54_008398, partial [Coelomomyces lativittatus]